MENDLNGYTRSRIHKGDTNKTRRTGRVPAVLYGRHEPNMMVEFAEMDLMNELHKTGEHGVINFNLNGSRERAIIKEVQKDPVTRRIMHMDLQRVDEDQRIRAKVPVVLKGEEYYKNTDTVLQQQVNEVDVYCKPGMLPKYFVLDVSKLSNKHRLTIGDIEAAEEISILNNLDSTVVSITHSKNTATEAESPSDAMAMHYDDTSPMA